MATSRLFRVFVCYRDGIAGRIGLTSTTTRWLSENTPIIHKESGDSTTSHINCAALERGVTKYFCNRNPRSLELMGMAEKPRGFATKNQRVDYYHR